MKKKFLILVVIAISVGYFIYMPFSIASKIAKLDNEVYIFEHVDFKEVKKQIINQIKLHITNSDIFDEEDEKYMISQSEILISRTGVTKLVNDEYNYKLTITSMGYVGTNSFIINFLLLPQNNETRKFRFYVYMQRYALNWKINYIDIIKIL